MLHSGKTTEEVGGGELRSEGDAELRCVVTNAQKAVGRRHQPGCAILSMEDMKEGVDGNIKLDGRD
jgi:hypothetical protein